MSSIDVDTVQMVLLYLQLGVSIVGLVKDSHVLYLYVTQIICT